MKRDLEFDDKVFEKMTDEWRLPESVMDDLERLFDEELASDPAGHLRRANNPRMGGEYHCRVEGKGTRRLVYSFIFRAYYKPSDNPGDKAIVVYDGFLKPLDLADFH